MVETDSATKASLNAREGYEIMADVYFHAWVPGDDGCDSWSWGKRLHFPLKMATGTKQVREGSFSLPHTWVKSFVHPVEAAVVSWFCCLFYERIGLLIFSIPYLDIEAKLIHRWKFLLPAHSQLQTDIWTVVENELTSVNSCDEVERHRTSPRKCYSEHQLAHCLQCWYVHTFVNTTFRLFYIWWVG